MLGTIIHWNEHPMVTSHAGGPKRWLSFFVFTMQAFGAERLTLVGGPAIEHGFDIGYDQVETLEEALALYPGGEQVALRGGPGKHLDKFVHPRGAVVYIVGPDYAELDRANLHKATFVSIKNPGRVAHLWSHNALAITLYDRSLKHGCHE